MRTTLIISGVSLLVAGIIAFLIVARYRKQFRLMLSEMNSVSQGIETLVHEVSPGIEAKPQEGTVLTHAKDSITELGDRLRSLEGQLGEHISYVRSQAYVDGLTGLGNRSAYEDHVKQLDDDIRDGKAAFAIAVFDLNGLKEINDRLGHEQGDKAIC